MLRLNQLSLTELRGDLYGGLTAAVIALPLALAFGVASGMGPVAGLYGAICVGFFAALFGGTNAQISGPTGPMTVVSASVFTQFAADPAIAFTVVMLAGGFQILFGYLKLGRYINLMPYPVISGFMTGVGCILIILQLEPLTGHIAASTVVNAITALPSDLISINWPAFGIGLFSFLLCLLMPKPVAKKLPPALLALVLGSVAALLIDGIPTLGEVPVAMPDLQLPRIDFAQLNIMLLSALVLAALGSIDSLLTSLVADNLTRTFHDSDKELVGQGVGNLLAGFVGGLPGAGATIRTLGNINAGGRTPLSGIFHAVVLLVIVLGLGRVVAFVPHAALAGILLKVGTDVIDWRFIKRINRAPRVDAVLMVIVLLVTIFVDVITAVAVGVVFASLIFVKEMAEFQAQSIRAIVGEEGDESFSKPENEAYLKCNRCVAVLHLSGPMSFGAANEMMRRIALINPVKVLVIDLTHVPGVDGSAARTLEEIIQRALQADQQVFVAGIQFGVARLLSRMGVFDELRVTTRFATRLEALKAAAKAIGNTPSSK